MSLPCCYIPLWTGTYVNCHLPLGGLSLGALLSTIAALLSLVLCVCVIAFRHSSQPGDTSGKGLDRLGEVAYLLQLEVFQPPAVGKGAQRIPRKHKNSNNMLLIEYQGPGEKQRGGGRGPIDHP